MTTNDPAEEPAAAVVVPHSALSAELLRAVVESFVLREGTDYGVREHSLEAKVAHVVLQLERGEAQVVYDPQTESVGIVAAGERGGKARPGDPR